MAQEWNEARESITPTLRWTPEPKNSDDKSVFMGEVIQGLYKNKKTGVGQNSSNIYEIQLPDGQLVGVWGSKLLDGRFEEIEIGMEVRLTYLGRVQPKTPNGRPYDNFKVEYAKPVTTMTEAQGATSSAPAAPADQAPAQPSQGAAPTTPGGSNLGF